MGRSSIPLAIGRPLESRGRQDRSISSMYPALPYLLTDTHSLSLRPRMAASRSFPISATDLVGSGPWLDDLPDHEPSESTAVLAFDDVGDDRGELARLSISRDQT